MATTWTDAIIYTDQEAFDDLPKLLSPNFTLTTDSAEYYLHTDVKQRLQEFILSAFNDFTNFDIEEIEQESIDDILAPIALQLNTGLVSRYTSKDPSDAYFALWEDYNSDVFARMRRIMKKSGLQYDKPAGINKRPFQSIPITR